MTPTLTSRLKFPFDNHNFIRYTCNMAIVYEATEDRDYYGTPPEWAERCRTVLDGIDLDPASCEEANRQVIRANRFMDKEMNALEQDWNCRSLFLNPPYSRTLLPAFAKKFRTQWNLNNIRESAIVLINNSTETGAFEQFSRCSDLRAEPCARIQFVSTEGRSVTGNPRGQVFFYYGPDPDLFSRVFRWAGCRIMKVVE